MPIIRYGYFSYPGSRSPKPMASAIAVNTLTGLSSEFLGILDTGADTVTLTSDLLFGLKIDPATLEDSYTGGVNGIGIGKKCNYIKIGLLDPLSLHHHFPNKNLPVPVVFSAGSPFCLLGRDLFLNLCTAVFEGKNKLVSLEF